MATPIERLIKAAEAVRDDVAYADVLFDPVADSWSGKPDADDVKKVRKADDALTKLCQALDAIGVAKLVATTKKEV